MMNYIFDVMKYFVVCGICVIGWGVGFKCWKFFFYVDFFIVFWNYSGVELWDFKIWWGFFVDFSNVFDFVFGCYYGDRCWFLVIDFDFCWDDIFNYYVDNLVDIWRWVIIDIWRWVVKKFRLVYYLVCVYMRF